MAIYSFIRTDKRLNDYTMT